MARVMDRRPDSGPEFDDADPDASDIGELDLEDADPEEIELPGPKPVMDRDPDEFTVMSAAKDGPLPPDVERDLRELADELEPIVDEGYVATRFGGRVIVAEISSPTDAVDVADIDIPRSIVLTLGGKDPGETGSLLAQVLFQRTDVTFGYAKAPEIKGPTVSNLRQLLPALRGPRAATVDGVGTVAVGHRPGEVRSAVEGLDAVHADEDDDDSEPAAEDAEDLMR